MKRYIPIVILVVIIIALFLVFRKTPEEAAPITSPTATSTPQVAQPDFDLRYQIANGNAVVEVYKGRNLHQTLTVESDIFTDNALDSNVQKVDVNFDGYKDISVLTCQGATGNQCFSFFLWNPTIEKFEYSKDFSDTLGFPNEKTKTIQAFWNMGCAGACYENKIFEVQDGKPVLVRRETQELSSDSKYATKVITTLKDGKYVTSTTTSKFENI